MSTHPTPRTDAAFDKYVTPPYIFGTADIREEMAKLERELAEAKGLEAKIAALVAAGDAMREPLEEEPDYQNVVSEWDAAKNLK